MRFLFSTFILLSFVTQLATAQNVIPSPVKLKILKGEAMVRKVDRKVDSLSLLPNEGYTIVTAGKKIKVRAKTEQGMVWAMQTLAQLTDSLGRTPAVEILDFPTTPIRGFMHDTGRNFIDIDLIKSHIDLLSAHKLNMFQWHLVDNPGWRIECRAYPELNDGKFQTRDFGKYYTYAQINDVITYARKRGVMVVPEIDIPGHSAYFKRTFGFEMASEKGMEVLKKCFAEFFANVSAADCPYMHIGSDEVYVENPEQFMRFAQNMVTSAGRQAVVWDPGLPADSTTIGQRWNTAAKANDDIRTGKFWDSSMGYLNYYDPIYFVRHIYHHKIPAGALGAELCLWNDVRVADKSKIAIHSGMLPGMLAFAELTWGGAPMDDFGAFEKRMMRHSAVNLKGEPFHYAPSNDIVWDIKIGDTVLNVVGGAVDLEILTLKYGLPLSDTAFAYAVTTIDAPCDTIVKVWIGFEVAARSNRASGGIPSDGCWENGGTITLNGAPIAPPKWNEPAKYGYNFNTWYTPENEIPYTDEQFYWLRKPTEICLKKGENRIEMTVWRKFAAQRWNFAFVIL